jgi:hypothetical protein
MGPTLSSDSGEERGFPHDLDVGDQTLARDFERAWRGYRDDQLQALQEPGGMSGTSPSPTTIEQSDSGSQPNDPIPSLTVVS